MFKKIILIIVLAYFSLIANAFAWQISTPEAKTADYFNKIKNDPEQLYIFLNQMPKGGDLHNHLSGATYAEDLLEYAKQDNLCIDPITFVLSQNPKCRPSLQIINIDNTSDFYRKIIENWSLDNFIPGEQSAEAHFFPTFIKFSPIVTNHMSEVLAEVVARAAAEQVSYLELMLTPFDLGLVNKSGNIEGEVDKNIVWQDDFAQMRTQLLNNGLLNFVKQIPPKLTAAEQQMRKQLKCGTLQADLGCQVKVRYQYLALREMPPLQVFAQLLIAFEAAKLDSRIAAINLVQAEDGPYAEKNYDLDMQMIGYLHKLYPQVHIALHAGELMPDNVTPEDLRHHIRHAIEIAHAERIGHGVDIAYEDNAMQLMKEMANKNIMVEINLTSNAKLLGIQGKDHPFPLYLRNQVPVALSTDDEGVLRTDITREYQHAVLTYQLDYLTLKRLARNSITYAFLPGASLWKDAAKAIMVDACKKDQSGTAKITSNCQQFLAKSEKAQLQWQLEKQFNAFEMKMASN
jgi:adenosine deaminase